MKSTNMIGIIVASVFIAVCGITYNEQMVDYLLKQDVYTAHGFMFMFIGTALFVLTYLFTSDVVDPTQEINIEQNNEQEIEHDNEQEYEKEIDYSDVPTTPEKIEPPYTRRRLQESDEQIREFVQIPSDDQDDSDSSWTPTKIH
jgi:hypothetical protein